MAAKPAQSTPLAQVPPEPVPRGVHCEHPARCGGHYFDGRKAQDHPACITVADGRLSIRPDDGTVGQVWALSSLSVRAAPGGGLVIRQGKGPAHLVVADPGPLAGHLRLPRRPVGWRMTLGASAVAIATAVFAIDAAPGWLAPLIPVAWEAPLGRAAEATVLSQHSRCRGEAGQRAIDRLTIRLAQAGGITAPIHVAVADEELVNAFTLPANRVLLLRGLIAAADDGNELAGVLAHELGHVAHRDTTRQMLRRFGINAVAAALGWTSGSAGGIAGDLVGLSYGRAAETAADAFAVAALRGAGLRADGLGRFFAHLEQQTAKGTGMGITFLSDHPATADREVLVQQPSDGQDDFDAAEWRDIRAMCKA